MRLTRKLAPWIAGLLAATLLFALLFVFTGFRYSGNDDSPILRSFMGYEGGTPARFNLYTHTAFAWLLYGLALAFPGVAWFSILQLFLLWFSCVVIVKGLVSCARVNGCPLWMGVLGGCLFIAAFAVFTLCRISYTTTGALAGAAAVAQILGVDCRRGSFAQILRGTALSIALLLCCYCLRQISVLPPLVFWLLALAWMALERCRPSRPVSPEPVPASGKEAPAPSSGQTQADIQGNAKPFLITALICALCFGVFAGVRAMELNALNLGDYLAWQDARIQLIDYAGFEDADMAALPDVGWTEAQTTLVMNWFFMDANITTQAFQTLHDALVADTPANSVRSSLQTLSGFLAANPAYVPACGVLGLLGLAGMLPLVRRRGQGIGRSLAVGAGLLSAVAMLLFLGYRGRLPMRAVASVFFPLAVFLLCLSMRPPRPVKTRNAAAITLLVCAGCIALAAASFSRTIPLLNPTIDPEIQYRLEAIPADLNEYALDNPDILIIYDTSLTGDNRLFPDTSDGIPPNLMFWGGWPAHSPSWLHQLSVYGIDGNALTAQDFLRGNVILASTDAQPWESFIAYVQESSEGIVDWDFYEYGYVSFFQLYEY